MSREQKNVINLIKRFSPKSFGIKNAYYKEDDNKLEFFFVVEEKGASSSISYLNSLSSLIERKERGFDIELNIYIQDNKKNIKSMVKKESFKELDLVSNVYYGGICT